MYSVVLAAMLTAGTGTPTWCNGCYGCHGCTGYVCSCHGCCGCYGCSGCHGCWGCYGCSGCHGCYGGYPVVAYAVPAYWGYSSCFGCWGGCYGCYGGVVVAAPVVAAVPVARNQLVEALLARAGIPAANSASAAQVTVKLPAEARLWVDGVACPLTSDTRSFATPSLQPGRQYVYTMKVEAIRNGQPVAETQRVVIAAGRKVQVNFGDLAPASLTRR